jgi:cytochrome c biogenesis protein CcmG, thiol:disulfide interchange protein DsbE
MRRALLVVVLAAVVSGVAGLLVVGLMHQDDVTASSTSPLVPVQLKAGTPAPSLRGDALDGSGTLDLTTYEGRPVVVNFWASWCGPCRTEAPELVAFSKAHPEVQMLAVNTNDQSHDAAVAFARKSDWVWPSVFDPSADIQHAWGVGGLPATFLVDADGKLRARKLGATTQAELASLVAGL